MVEEKLDDICEKAEKLMHPLGGEVSQDIYLCCYNIVQEKPVVCYTPEHYRKCPVYIFYDKHEFKKE